MTRPREASTAAANTSRVSTEMIAALRGSATRTIQGESGDPVVQGELKSLVVHGFFVIRANRIARGARRRTGFLARARTLSEPSSSIFLSRGSPKSHAGFADSIRVTFIARNGASRTLSFPLARDDKSSGRVKVGHHSRNHLTSHSWCSIHHRRIPVPRAQFRGHT